MAISQNYSDDQIKRIVLMSAFHQMTHSHTFDQSRGQQINVCLNVALQSTSQLWRKETTDSDNRELHRWRNPFHLCDILHSQALGFYMFRLKSWKSVSNIERLWVHERHLKGWLLWGSLCLCWIKCVFVKAAFFLFGGFCVHTFKKEFIISSTFLGFLENCI